jgi:hypothetical protein
MLLGPFLSLVGRKKIRFFLAKLSIRSHDQIVTLPAPREIFPRVVDDMVGANRSRGVDIPGAAHGSNFRPE